MVTRQEMEEFVEGMLAARQCTPEYPHEGKLRYTGGPQGEYRCECGARYRKDGRGGLTRVGGS